MWYMHEGFGWWMAFGGLWMLIFWGGIITLVVWGIIKLTGRNSSIQHTNPLETAKERYVKGEISREEYEQIKKDLL